MKIDISPRDCRFIVNKEKGKVICIIDNTSELFYDFMNFPYWKVWARIPEDRLTMPDRFVGIATCDPEDEFDEEIGRMIAFTRAKNKLNTSFFKRANYFVNEVDRQLASLVESFNDYGDQLMANAEKREKMIADKVGKGVFLNKPEA